MRRAPCVPWLLLLASALAFPADFASLKPQGYISDYAGVLSAPVRAQLERYCAEVEAKTGAQIAVLLIPSLQGEPIEDVAVDVFQKWGVGKKGTDEGVLLLLATQDRRMRLEVGYGLEPVIPDGFAGDVLRAMRPSLRANDYGAAVTDAIRTLGERIAASKGVKIGEALPPSARRARPESAPDLFPLVFIGLLFALWMIALARAGRRYGRMGRTHGTDVLTGMLIGSILGRSMGGPRGGGGFGGYSGGGFGGFGGFGGGRSGGGGASGSW
jgi:uncharacterized protein